MDDKNGDEDEVTSIIYHSSFLLTIESMKNIQQIRPHIYISLSFLKLSKKNNTNENLQYACGPPPPRSVEKSMESLWKDGGKVVS